jgi:hypothetical protein
MIIWRFFAENAGSKKEAFNINYKNRRTITDFTSKHYVTHA